MQNSEQGVGKLSQVKLKNETFSRFSSITFVVHSSSFFIPGWGPAVAETIGVLIQCGKKSRTYTVLQNKQNDRHQIIH